MPYFKNNIVVITGHAGFKGSWLSTWLLQLGTNISGLSDRVPTDPVYILQSWQSFWQPIIATKTLLELIGYGAGTCPVSGVGGPMMVNVPYAFSAESIPELLEHLKEPLR